MLDQQKSGSQTPTHDASKIEAPDMYSSLLEKWIGLGEKDDRDATRKCGMWSILPLRPPHTTGKPRAVILRNEAHIRDTLELACTLHYSIFVHRDCLDIECPVATISIVPIAGSPSSRSRSRK